MKAFVLCLLLCGSLFAQEFQLELMHEFEISEPSLGSYYLPPWNVPYHPWDVQYWMNDSLPGWAALIDSTIYYQTDIAQPLQSFVVPTYLDSAQCEQFGLNYSGFVNRVTLTRDIYLVRWPSRLNHDVFITIRTAKVYSDDSDYLSYFLLIWDATNGDLILAKQITNSQAGSAGGGWSSFTEMFTDMTVSPPLPAISNEVFWATRYSYSFDNPGHVGGGSGGAAHVGLVQGDSLAFVPLPEDAIRIKPFARCQPLTLALFHSYYSSDDVDNRWRGLSTLVLGNPASMDTLEEIYIAELVTQVDNDGGMRIFNSRRYAHSAFDHELLWANHDIPEDPYNRATYLSARCGSLDEHFWVNEPDSTYFLIYRAANGNLMGRTSDFLGKPKYFIKSHPLYDRLVTYDEENHLVRIYRTPAIQPLGLTLHPAGNNTMLHLDWQPVPGANRYSVFYKNTPASESPYFVGTTAETNSTIPMPVNDKGCFYVEVAE